jgi:hypothetical protein
MKQHRCTVEIPQAAQTVLPVSGFGALDHVREQRLGQLGGVVLGSGFKRMEERRDGRGPAGFLKPAIADGLPTRATRASRSRVVAGTPRGGDGRRLNARTASSRSRWR